MDINIKYVSCSWGRTKYETLAGRETVIDRVSHPITASQCRRMLKGGTIDVNIEHDEKTGFSLAIKMSDFKPGTFISTHYLQGKGDLIGHVTASGGYGNCNYENPVTYKNRSYLSGVIYVEVTTKINPHQEGSFLPDEVSPYRIFGMRNTADYVEDLPTIGTIVFETPSIPECRLKEVFPTTPGLVYRPTGKTTNAKTVVLTEDQEDRALGMSMLKQVEFCGKTMFETSLTDILVHVVNKSEEQTLGVPPVKASDINHLLDVNGRMQTLHIAMETTVDRAFSLLAKEDCELGRQQMVTVLEQVASGGGGERSLSKILYGRSQGIEVHKAGTSVYLVNCTKVPAQIVQTDQCCQEISVMIDNDPHVYYVDPLSLILRKNCTKVPLCKKLPIVWTIGNKTLCSDPKIYECSESLELDPNKNKNTSIFDGTTDKLSKGFIDQDVQKELEQRERARDGAIAMIGSYGFAAADRLNGGVQLGRDLMASLGDAGAYVVDQTLGWGNPFLWFWRQISPHLLFISILCFVLGLFYRTSLMAYIMKRDYMKHSSCKRLCSICTKNSVTLFLNNGTIRNTEKRYVRADEKEDGCTSLCEDIKQASYNAGPSVQYPTLPYPAGPAVQGPD